MLPDALPRVLDALIRSRNAWISIPQLASALGRADAATAMTVVELNEQGYLDVWYKDPAPVVTLSAWGAATLGVRLTEAGAANVFRWVRSSDRAEPPPRPRRRPREGVAAVDLLEDGRPGPAELAELSEAERIRAESRAGRGRRAGRPPRADDVPRPSILLEGHGLWHWSERDRGRRPETRCPACERGRKKKKIIRSSCECGRGLRPAPRLDCCPGCGGRELSRAAYCLRCGRWGWDDVFSPPAGAVGVGRRA